MFKKLFNKYKLWVEERKLNKIIDEAMLTFPMKPIQQIVKKSHETYKIGNPLTSKLTATLLGKAEAKGRAIERSLEWQQKEQERVTKAEAVWLNTVDPDDKKEFDN